MAGYDPQRDRRRRRTEDDEGPAPIDEMLAAPAESATGARLVGAVTAGVESTSPATPADVPAARVETVPQQPPPRRLALVVALAFLALLIAMVVRRRRRRSSGDD